MRRSISSRSDGTRDAPEWTLNARCAHGDQSSVAAVLAAGNAAGAPRRTPKSAWADSSRVSRRSRRPDAPGCRIALLCNVTDMDGVNAGGTYERFPQAPWQEKQAKRSQASRLKTSLKVQPLCEDTTLTSS